MLKHNILKQGGPSPASPSCPYITAPMTGIHLYFLLEGVCEMKMPQNSTRYRTPGYYKQWFGGRRAIFSVLNIYRKNSRPYENKLPWENVKNEKKTYNMNYCTIGFVNLLRRKMQRKTINDSKFLRQLYVLPIWIIFSRTATECYSFPNANGPEC